MNISTRTPDATLVEVDAGTETYKYVSPYTLANSALAADIANKIEVVGGSPSDNAIARFHSTGGNVQTSIPKITDAGDLNGVRNITLTGTVDGRDLSAILDVSTTQNALVKYSDTSGSQTSQNRLSLSGSDLRLEVPSPGSSSDIPTFCLNYNAEPDDLVPGPAQVIGEIQFLAHDSAANETEYGVITATSNLTVNTSEFGRISLGATSAGSRQILADFDGLNYVSNAFATAPVIAMHGYLDFPSSTYALMIRNDDYAFRAREAKPAGLKFMNTGTSRYAFCSSGGAETCTISIAQGNIRIASGNGTGRGLDTIAAGTLVLGRDVATKVECYTDFEHTGTNLGFYGTAGVSQAAAITKPSATTASLKTAVDLIIDAIGASLGVGITA